MVFRILANRLPARITAKIKRPRHNFPLGQLVLTSIRFEGFYSYVYDLPSGAVPQTV